MAHLGAFYIGELTVLALHDSGVDHLPGAKRLFHGVAGEIVFELAAHKRSALAWLDVQKLCGQRFGTHGAVAEGLR